MRLKERIGNFFSALLAWMLVIMMIPVMFLVLLWEIIYTPIGYIKFKNSRYQKDYPQKFTWLSKPHKDNEVYTIIKENELEIEYFKFRDDYEMPGFFLYKDTLLDFGEPFFYDDKKELWLCWLGDEAENVSDEDTEFMDEENTDDCMTVDAIREIMVDEFCKNYPDRECKKVIFFYQRKNVERNYGIGAVETMENLEDFVLYEKGDLANAIIKTMVNI